MTELSPNLAARARKIETSVLRAFACVSQRQIADATGLSETKVSRMKGEDLYQFALVLAAAGLRVVGEHEEVVSRTEKAFMAEKMIDHYQAVLDECR